MAFCVSSCIKVSLWPFGKVNIRCQYSNNYILTCSPTPFSLASLSPCAFAEYEFFIHVNWGFFQSPCKWRLREDTRRNENRWSCMLFLFLRVKAQWPTWSLLVERPRLVNLLLVKREPSWFGCVLIRLWNSLPHQSIIFISASVFGG